MAFVGPTMGAIRRIEIKTPHNGGALVAICLCGGIVPLVVHVPKAGWVICDHSDFARSSQIFSAYSVYCYAGVVPAALWNHEIALQSSQN